MPVTPTFQEIYDIGKAEVIARDAQLTDWEEGSINDVLVGLGAALADGNYGKTTEEFRKTFVLSSFGADLTDLAKDHYDLDRYAATAAAVTLTLTRANTDAGDVVLTPDSRISTEPDADGVSVDFAPDDTYTLTGLTLDIQATCTDTGTAGNVNADALIVFKTSLTDSSVTVTNADPAAGGTAEESDEALQARIYEYLKSLVRGTKAAIEYGAKTVDGVTMAHLDETSRTVYVADTSGNSNDIMLAAVLAELENWQAVGPILNVLGVALSAPAIEMAITYAAGVDETAVAAAVVAAIVVFVNRTAIAAELLVTDLVVVAKRVDGVKDVVVSLPAANLASIANTLRRIDAGDVTLT